MSDEEFKNWLETTRRMIRDYTDDIEEICAEYLDLEHCSMITQRIRYIFDLLEKRR